MTDHKKGLAAAHRAAGKAATDRYKAANPDAAALKIKANVVAFKPRPRGMRDHAVKAVRLFLGDRSYLAMTNAEIAAHLSADEAGYNAPSNLLTERFSSNEKTRVLAMLKEKGIELDADKLKTPSAVKRALKAYRSGEQSDDRFKADVVFTDTTLIVNGKAYPISGESTRRRVRVGEARLNLKALRDLLAG